MTQQSEWCLHNCGVTKCIDWRDLFDGIEIWCEWIVRVKWIKTPTCENRKCETVTSLNLKSHLLFFFSFSLTSSLTSFDFPDFGLNNGAGALALGVGTLGGYREMLEGDPQRTPDPFGTPSNFSIKNMFLKLKTQAYDLWVRVVSKTTSMGVLTMPKVKLGWG